MIDSATSPLDRAPMSSPAGVCTRLASARSTSSDASTASPRLRLATSPTYGTPARNAAVSATSSSRPWLATTTADTSAPIPAASPTTSASGTSHPRCVARARSERATGASPNTTSRGAGSTGSRKISSVPPDRHALCTTSLPGCGGSGSGVIRSSNDSPESISASPCASTVDSAHVPPTNPSIVPSGSTSASSPGLALVGRSANTTRACTYGTRAVAQPRSPIAERGAVGGHGWLSPRSPGRSGTVGPASSSTPAPA